MVERSLEIGQSIIVTSVRQETSLHVAAIADFDEIAQLLILNHAAFDLEYEHGHRP